MHKTPWQEVSSEHDEDSLEEVDLSEDEDLDSEEGQAILLEFAEFGRLCAEKALEMLKQSTSKEAMTQAWQSPKSASLPCKTKTQSTPKSSSPAGSPKDSKKANVSDKKSFLKN